MLFKLPFLAALAAVSVSAAPSANLVETTPDVLDTRAMVEQRDCDTPNGAAFLYQQTGYAGNASTGLILTAYKGQEVLCTLFSPKFKQGFNLRSYVFNQLGFVAYTSKDCSGSSSVAVFTSGKSNTLNPNVNYQGLNSFQILYYNP